MIDNGYYWMTGICDICRKDTSSVQKLEAGIMKDGQWIGGYSDEKAQQYKTIWAEWEKSITVPCLRINGYEEDMTICEKHLLEMLAAKEVI